MNACSVLTNNTSRDVLEVCTLSSGKFLPDIYTENSRLISLKLAKGLSNEVAGRHLCVKSVQIRSFFLVRNFRYSD